MGRGARLVRRHEEDHAIKPIFNKSPSVGTTILLLCLLALGLMYSDRVHWLRDVRAQLLELSTPFYFLTDLPGRLKDWGSEVSLSRSALIEDNNHLRAEALVLQSKIQKLASLATENVRLRELLNSSALLQDNVVVAEIIGVSPDPLRHLVIVNRGSEDKVFVGQPVLDANGLFGQVVEVSSSTCRVLLLTDSTHAIPVQVNRNGGHRCYL
jgi:rod shape-determining protein MreC